MRCGRRGGGDHRRQRGGTGRHDGPLDDEVGCDHGRARSLRGPRDPSWAATLAWRGEERGALRSRGQLRSLWSHLIATEVRLSAEAVRPEAPQRAPVPPLPCAGARVRLRGCPRRRTPPRLRRGRRHARRRRCPQAALDRGRPRAARPAGRSPPALLADLVWAGEPPPAPRTARCTPTSPASARCSSRSGRRGPRRPCSRRPTTATVLRVDAPLTSTPTGSSPTYGRLERGLAPLATQLSHRRPRPAGPTGRRRSAWSSSSTTGTALASWRRTAVRRPRRTTRTWSRSGPPWSRLRAAGGAGPAAGPAGARASTPVPCRPPSPRSPPTRCRSAAWALHALALTRSGRQAEALDSLRAVPRAPRRGRSASTPAPELRDLEQAILRQDAGARRRTLDPVAAPAALAAPARRPHPRPTLRPSAARRNGPRCRDLLTPRDRAPPAARCWSASPGSARPGCSDDLERRGRPTRAIQVAAGTCSQDDGAPPLWPWLGRAPLPRTRPATWPGSRPTPSRRRASRGRARPSRPADRIAQAAARGRPSPGRSSSCWTTCTGPTTRPCARCGTWSPVTPRDGPALPSSAPAVAHPEPTGALAERRRGLRPAPRAPRSTSSGLDLAEAPHAGGGSRRARGRSTPTSAALAPSERTATRSSSSSWPGSRRRPREHEVPGHASATSWRDGWRDLPTDGRWTRCRLAAVVGRGASAPRPWPPPGGATSTTCWTTWRRRARPGLVDDAEAGDYAFVHALTRDAVRLSLSPTRRARLHAQVAHALESDPALRALVHRRGADRRARLALARRRSEPPRQGLAGGPERRPTRPASLRWLPGGAAAAHGRGRGASEQRPRATRPSATTCCSSSPRTRRTPPAGRRVEEAAFGGGGAGPTARLRRSGSAGRPPPCRTTACGCPTTWTRCSRTRSRTCAGRSSTCRADDRADALPAPAGAGRRALLRARRPRPSGGRSSTPGLALARRSGDPTLLWWATRAAWMALVGPAPRGGPGVLG